ncbi:substrate-binding domain-containing protein [Tessaracoccus coleopterorum]|uniref:substrate-binding domain-containing protein n=1 Tax=Tessaracoccus coleopterorum TaxID=2714950 RepID=UPI002F90BAC2
MRELFVNQTTTQNHGATLAETLADAMGGSGKFAIVSCGETATNLNAYIDAAKEKMTSDYPDIEFTQTVYAGEDQAKAAQMATDLMNADPEINGLIGICASAAPAVAQAVQDAGRIGEVFTVGGGTPMT